MKKRSMALVALLVMCAMLMSGFAVSAAIDTTTAYSFTESFDVAKEQAVSEVNSAEAYSQFVTVKVDGATGDEETLAAADGQLASSSNIRYGISPKNAVPSPGEYVIDPTGKKTSYYMDIDTYHITAGNNNKSAVYVGVRVPGAHATESEVFYNSDSAHGIWLGIGTTNAVVAVETPVSGGDPEYTIKRWTGLGTTMRDNTHFRVYDNVKDNVVTFYMVDGEGTETFFASITVGTYDEENNITPLTYQVMSQEEYVLNVPGTIYSGETCYPQVYVYRMKPQIYSFGVTGCGVDDAGLTSLEFNGEAVDLSTFTYDAVDPLEGGKVTVEATAGWGTDYAIYTYDEAGETWTPVVTNDGVNTINVSETTAVKVAVNACGEALEYVFNLSDNNPGNVTISPEAGHYETAQEVTLTGSGKDNAEIYYTVDGSDPKVNGTLYEAPFTVPANAETTVKAVEKMGSVYGNVAESVFDIYIDVEEPSFSLELAEYLTAKSLVLSTEEDTTIYYTLDESDPTDEENLSRVEYTQAIELALVPNVKTTYVVKAAAFRDGTYSSVVTKTYGIGVQKEFYTIDPTKIVNATDPNFNSHDGTPATSYYFTAGDEGGWIKVERGADNSVQWEIAVLKTEVTSAKQGYSIDFDIKGMDNRTSGHQGVSVYLRKKTTGITSAALTGVYREAPVIMIYKDKIGMRNGSWGNNCADMLAVPGMDLSEASHITVTDDYVNDIAVVYVDDTPIAYGKLDGTTFTLTVLATGETSSVTLSAALADSGYPAIAISHSPAQIKDFTVAVGRPAGLNIVTASNVSGEYENNVEVTLTKYNDDLTIYYTLDGTDPTTGGTEYAGPVNITESATLKVVATDGTVSTEVYEWNYTIVPYQPGEVRFSIEGGEYPSAQTLILEGTGKPGAVVYYTIDGSDPSDSTNTNRVLYAASAEIDIPNNAATTVKAVEIIGNLTGTVYTNSYYTGTVKSPAVPYYTDVQKLVIGQDTTWIAPDNRTTTSSFSLVEGTTDTIIVSNGSDGTRQTASMRFYKSLSAADRAYKLEMDITGLESVDTHRGIYISPRSALAESITAYNTPRIIFQGSKIGIRTGAWAPSTASKLLNIPGMDLTTGGHLEFVDDMVKNMLLIFVDGELVVVGKISGNTITLTAIATGEQIVWSGTVAASGYPRITAAHANGEMKNIVLKYPYDYDLPVLISHRENSYVGAQTVTLTNHFGTPVYYTLDGSDPTDSTNTARVLYSTPITINVGTTTLKAAYYDESNAVYGGSTEHTYRIYADETEVVADLEVLVTEEKTLEEQKVMIDAIFSVAGFTIENDSYYKALDDTDVWVEAYVEVLKEAREEKGSELDFTDAKNAAYKAAVVAYFMDSIEADAVSALVTKANDEKQQYKMNIPLGELGFDDMPEAVQTWILNKIKENDIPDVEALYEIMYEAVALSTVSADCDVDGYSKSERANALTVIMNTTDMLTEDDTFADWGLGSKKQNNAINKILESAEDETITTMEQLKEIAADAIESAGGSSGGDNDGPGSSGGTGGTGSFNTSLGSVVIPEVKVKFADAKSDAPWAYDAIINLSNNAIVSGYPDGTFRANNNVTREEYVKMLVVALDLYDESATCEFTDASQGNWYDAYIASAVKHGIIKGISDTEFGVGVNISRQDMAVIAYRALQSLNKQLPDVQEVVEFTDETSIAEYAAEAVDELQAANIINGMGDGTFAPGANANRAQAAYIINSILSAVQA